MASSVGGLTNPSKLANTIMTEMGVKTNSHTVGEYMECFRKSFLFEKAERWNVKGRKYIGSPVKYYAEDTGLRNARLNFRQMERTHLMENVIYCELCRRGYAVDVGVVHTVGPNQAISKIAQYRNQISTLLGVTPVDTFRACPHKI